MKLKSYILVTACIAFYSCVTFKQYDNRAKESRDPSYEVFIVKKDGQLISGKTFKHKDYDSYDPNIVTVTNKNDAFKMDDKKYNDSDVVIFQDKKGYHKRFNRAYLIRLVTGKMNLYYFDNTGYTKTYTNSATGPTTIQSTNNRITTFYLEKEKDKIIPIGMGAFKEAVKDNPEALEQLNKYYPKDAYSSSKELNIEKVVAVVKLYNQ